MPITPEKRARKAYDENLSKFKSVMLHNVSGHIKADDLLSLSSNELEALIIHAKVAKRLVAQCVKFNWVQPSQPNSSENVEIKEVIEYPVEIVPEPIVEEIIPEPEPEWDIDDTEKTRIGAKDILVLDTMLDEKEHEFMNTYSIKVAFQNREKKKKMPKFIAIVEQANLQLNKWISFATMAKFNEFTEETASIKSKWNNSFVTRQDYINQLFLFEKPEKEEKVKAVRKAKKEVEKVIKLPKTIDDIYQHLNIIKLKFKQNYEPPMNKSFVAAAEREIDINYDLLEEIKEKYGETIDLGNGKYDDIKKYMTEFTRDLRNHIGTF